MLNLNYNINNALLNKNRLFLLGKADWQWSLSTYVASGIFRSPGIVFGTGSIEYVPFAATTIFASSSYETGSLYSGSAAGLPVNVAITGSGVWPVTGSNTLSIVIGSNAGFNKSNILTLSAAAGNMNLSGSKISSSFNPDTNQQYNISFGIQHIKGNIYNPVVNWNSKINSPITASSVNGEGTTSFNIVKNTNESLVNVSPVTQTSVSGAFDYQYNFGVTASYTASINNVTGSTTMSFVCAEEGLNKTSYFFNPNTTTAIATGSFVATNDTIHNLVTSITYNKGNVNNGPINWISRNQSPVSNIVTLNGYTASFNLVKDRNVSMVSFPQVTGSRFGSFNNNYAFNFTSSLTASIQAGATGSVTMSLEIPEAGISTSSLLFSATSAGVNTITASFDTRNENPYNITASVIFNKGNISNTPINWRNIAKSDSQDLLTDGNFINGNSSSFNIIKDKDVSVIAIPYASQSNSGTFTNNYAFNITSSLTASILPNTTGSVTMSLSIPETGFFTSSQYFNWTSAGNKILSASFVSTTASSSFNITASIINNKGNMSNANLNYLATASNMATNGVTSSFQMVKDANVKIVGVDNMLSGVQSTIKNNYAFNVTASLSGSFTSSWADITSQSLRTNRFYFAIPETGFVTESLSSPVNWTASFVATTDSASYNITASCLAYSSSAILVQASVVSGSLMNSVNTITIDADGLDFIANGTSSLKFYTSSVDNYGSFVPKTIVGSGSNISISNYKIANFPQNYFPYPYIPTYDAPEYPDGLRMVLAYWGTPTMAITGSSATTYFSGSNITVHRLASGATASYYQTITPTTASHLLAETLTIAGGGRGGIKDWNPKINPSGYEYIFSGGGGAGGYVLANNYFQKGKTYNVVVGAGAPRYNGLPITPSTPQTGSDSFIYNGDDYIQLAKGGGNGGPVTGSGWDGPDKSTYGAGGRQGGSAGGAGKLYGLRGDELGAESISGSVSNIFVTYGAFDGWRGGDVVSAYFGGYDLAGGGGGRSQAGGSNFDPVQGGFGGTGFYDLSFVPQGVCGGGAGANRGADATGSLAFGGGDGQRYTISGSISACDGVDGTGGGGGGLISSSAQPYNAPFNYTTKGGSGKVQIRYQSASPLATGGTIESGSISGSLYILHTFTASGTFTPL